MYHVVVRHNLHLRKLTINAVLLAVALFSLSVILAKGLSASPQHSKYLGLDLLLAVALELLLGLFERFLMDPLEIVQTILKVIQVPLQATSLDPSIWSAGVMRTSPLPILQKGKITQQLKVQH